MEKVNSEIEEVSVNHDTFYNKINEFYSTRREIISRYGLNYKKLL